MGPFALIHIEAFSFGRHKSGTNSIRFGITDLCVAFRNQKVSDLFIATVLLGALSSLHFLRRDSPRFQRNTMVDGSGNIFQMRKTETYSKDWLLDAQNTSQ